MVGVALLELKVVRHGRLVLRRSGDDHGDQAQGGDEKDLEKQGVRFGFSLGGVVVTSLGRRSRG